MATLTRMGRKPLPDEERKDKPLRIRLADPEREAIDRAAEENGQNSSRWAREILLREAEKQLASKRRKR